MSEPESSLRRDWLLWWALSVLVGVAVPVGLHYLAGAWSRTHMVEDFHAIGILMTLCAPFLQGGITSYMIMRMGAGDVTAAIAGALTSCAILFAGTILFEYEGFMCWFMILPLWAVCLVLGAFVGASAGKAKHGNYVMLSVTPLVIAASLGGDVMEKPSRDKTVATSIDIAATPEEIWPHLFNLSDMPEPEWWMFRMGVAYPKGTRTEGQSRTCVLSTGEMREHIEVSNRGRELQWTVENTPATMKEFNPFGDPHPAHLENSFSVLRGGFRLKPLPDGGTRLEGWTSFRSTLEPDAYWGLWNRKVVYEVQMRMLKEIRTRAEQPSDR